MEFTAAVARLRAEHPTFRRKRFFTGNTVRTRDGGRLNDIVWLDADATPMEGEDWHADGGAVLGMYLNGDGIPDPDATGNRVTDDHFLLWFNAGAEPVPATLPPEEYAAAWDVVIDTGDTLEGEDPRPAGSVLELAGRSVVVLRRHTTPEVEVDHSVAASIKAQATNGE